MRKIFSSLNFFERETLQRLMWYTHYILKLNNTINFLKKLRNTYNHLLNHMLSLQSLGYYYTYDAVHMQGSLSLYL